jgi:hypothetical protein
MNWRIIIFWVYFFTAVTATLFGVVWVAHTFGLGAMWAVVLLIILLSIRMERHRPSYFEGGPVVINADPVLPPPGKRQLPAPRPAQLTKPQRPALPGPAKK